MSGGADKRAELGIVRNGEEKMDHSVRLALLRINNPTGQESAPAAGEGKILHKLSPGQEVSTKEIVETAKKPRE